MSRISRLLNVARLRSLDRDFADELHFHLEQRIERNLRVGMTKEQAEADAYARFGSIDRAKAGMREARLAWSHELALGVYTRAGSVVVAVIGVVLVTMLLVASGGWRSSAVYELSDGVSAPVPLDSRTPQYTAAAKRAKVQGVVRVQCVVRPNGVCSDAHVVTSLDQTFGLDEQALNAVRMWQFRPAILEGSPVSTRIVMEFKFALR